jgi:hypothetical protein
MRAARHGQERREGECVCLRVVSRGQEHDENERLHGRRAEGASTIAGFWGFRVRGEANDGGGEGEF